MFFYTDLEVLYFSLPGIIVYSCVRALVLNHCRMELVQQSNSCLLTFLLFFLCLSDSVHMAAGSDSSTAMGSSIRSVEDAVYLNVQRTDYYIAPSQLKLECDSASGGDVSFWREQNGLTEQITVAGSVSGGREGEKKE